MRSRLASISRRAWIIIGAGVLVIALAMVAWLSPVLSVRTVSVTGLDQVPREEILEALGPVEGSPLLRVDTTAAAHRVAGIARVAQVRVKRDYPSTLTVEVLERTPWAYYDGPGGPHMLDQLGVDYAIAPPPPGLPKISTPQVLGDPELLRAGLAVLGEMPRPLWNQVSELAINSKDDLELTLQDGRKVRWGNASDTVLKGAVALAILTQPGQVFDVSSPSLPTAK